MTEETTLRRCIGSKRFGIELHDASVEDFPKQPSQKDGLGRMCKVHWNVYTAGLARDAKARKAALARKAADGEVPAEVAPTEPTPIEPPTPVRTRGRRGAKAVAPAAGSQGDAG